MFFVVAINNQIELKIGISLKLFYSVLFQSAHALRDLLRASLLDMMALMKS